jgi:hypothetical protein
MRKHLPPGPGRPKGSKNKANARREAEIKASGLTPLDYMLSVLRGEESTSEDRKWASQAAAPYVHPRLSQVDARHSGEIDLRAFLQKLGEPD